jgi:hypothetical protein
MFSVHQFSQRTPVSSINKTDRHDITEILLKVALSTINLIIEFYILTEKYIDLLNSGNVYFVKNDFFIFS